MRKVKMYAIILLIALISTGYCSKVPAGHVGVKVYLLGQSKGVDAEELGVGRYWIGWNEELYLFPTFQQNYVWTKESTEGSPDDESFTFQTKEGMTVNADIGIAYHIDKSKATGLFQRYRKGVEELTDIVLRNYVRDALNNIAGTFPIDSVYGSGKAELISKVKENVGRQVATEGIIIDNIFWIGELRLPESVTEAINLKLEATQRAQQRENEVAEARAEADKKIAEARGEAESLRLKASAITQQNLELERLAIKRILAEKWNGQLPTTMVPGQTVPFMNIQ